MKKIISCFWILLLVFACSSCSLSSFLDKTDTSDNNVEQINITGEKVTINVSDNTSIITSDEEAIAKAYESVVVINSTSISGTSSGSGVIIGSSESYTYIITCHHVIEGFSSFEVILANGDTVQGKLVGGDPNTDIAVVMIEKTSLPIATFVSDSDQIKIGSTAIAIGNPLGTLSNTVTKGIISALSRKITMSDGTAMELLQTDAAINSGNSGGGLFNSQGELVGVVNAKYSATGVEGLGFAIPANKARAVAMELIENGYVSGRYLLGFTLNEGYYRTNGFFGSSYKVVYVSSITKNSSADGVLEVEDFINSIEVSYADKTKETDKITDIETAKDAQNFLDSLELSIGDKLIFTIKRGGYNVSETTVEMEIKQYIYK